MAHVTILNPLKKSSFKLSTGKVPALGPWVTFLELTATRPRFRSVLSPISATPCLLKMLLQLIGAVCAPSPRWGVQLPQSPHRKSPTSLKKREDKASPGPATKHTHTLHSSVRLTLKKRYQTNTATRRGSQTKNPFWVKTKKASKRRLLY